MLSKKKKTINFETPKLLSSVKFKSCKGEVDCHMTLASGVAYRVIEGALAGRHL